MCIIWETNCVFGLSFIREYVVGLTVWQVPCLELPSVKDSQKDLEEGEQVSLQRRDASRAV